MQGVFRRLSFWSATKMKQIRWRGLSDRADSHHCRVSTVATCQESLWMTLFASSPPPLPHCDMVETCEHRQVGLDQRTVTSVVSPRPRVLPSARKHPQDNFTLPGWLTPTRSIYLHHVTAALGNRTKFTCGISLKSDIWKLAIDISLVRSASELLRRVYFHRGEGSAGASWFERVCFYS